MNLTTNGFTEVSNCLTAAECEDLAAALAEQNGRSGRRDLLTHAGIQRLIARMLLPVAEQELGNGALAVSATLFDKRPKRNWKVSWHQDLSVPAANTQFSVSVKDGIPHVQPGPNVLERLVLVRVNLDNAGPAEGGLRLVPGSHQLGVIAEDAIPPTVQRLGAVDTVCPRGSLLLMRPLLLHASSAASLPARRRVLQVLFAPHDLAEFGWHIVVPTSIH